MQAICLDRDTVHISTEDGRGQSLDLCFNFVIQLLVVFMLPYHHHQTASLHAHGSSQVLPEDGKLEGSCARQAAKAKYSRFSIMCFQDFKNQDFKNQQKRARLNLDGV